MGLVSVDSGQQESINVLNVLASDTLLFSIRAECYVSGSGSFPNETTTLPKGLYKVGSIAMLHEGFVVHHAWLEMERTSFGLWLSETEVILPVFMYLDVYNTDFSDRATDVVKIYTGDASYASDANGVVFETMFRETTGAEGSGLNRFVLKPKPYLLGWLKVCDEIQVTNLTSNCTIDVNLDMVR